jgi:hypothetical protein
MYYSIDDQYGDNLCGGIAPERISTVAQQYANDLGALVHVYSSDGSEEYDVEPSEEAQS